MSGKVKPRIRGSVEAKNNAKDTYLSFSYISTHACRQIHTQRHIDIFIKTLRICFLRCFKIDSQIRTFGLLIVVPKLCDEVESNRERNTNKLPYAKRKKIPQSMQALDSAFASS